MPTTIHASIESWITNWLSSNGLSTQTSISLLLGDGSSRAFYRITTPQHHYILVSDPQWTQTQDYPQHQRYLKDLGLPVPLFYSSDPSKGFLLMQDLGDELLQFRINKNPAELHAWLSKAVKLLADLHGKTFPVPATLPVAQRSFDTNKYFSELEFTFEYLNQKLLNQPKMAPSQLDEIKHFCAMISNLGPQVFSHRDYHCRNLMILNNELVMIDFQDARMGSPHYDLASILYDAYQPLSDENRSELITIYKNHLAKYSVSDQVNWSTFNTDLKQVAFQRTLKAAGSFASFFIRFGKTTHWPYLIPALREAKKLQEGGFGVSTEILDIEKSIALISQIKLQ